MKFNMDAHMHFDLYKNRQDVLDSDLRTVIMNIIEYIP